MKVFQNLKEHIEFFTSYNAQPFQTLQRWNIRIAISIFLVGTYCVSSLIFTLFEAKTFQEYNESFYLSVTAVNLGTVQGLLIWNIEKFYKFCDNIDGVIQRRGESLSRCEI